MEKIKIAVCIPWDTPFVWTAPMFNMLNWERPANSEVRFIMGAGWCPASSHNDKRCRPLMPERHYGEDAGKNKRGLGHGTGNDPIKGCCGA